MANLLYKKNRLIDTGDPVPDLEARWGAIRGTSTRFSATRGPQPRVRPHPPEKEFRAKPPDMVAERMGRRPVRSRSCEK